jgi:DNA-binding MarR family transcriptional regulator
VSLQDPVGDTIEPDAATRQAATIVRRSAKRLARRLRAERAEHGVSSSKLSVLGHLLRRGAMTATELAALEHVQPQSLTRLLVGLEERGLILREQVETDRRQVRIEITQQGRDLMAHDSRRQDVWLSRVMADQLTEVERDLLTVAARLLDRLSDQPLSPARSQPEGSHQEPQWGT